MDYLSYIQMYFSTKIDLNTKKWDLAKEVKDIFFSLIVPTTDPIKLIELLQSKIELKLKEHIEKHSLMYWLHLYRRISPKSTEKDLGKGTVWLYRHILESAFFKYATKNSADMMSTNDPDKILNGLYIEACKSLGADISTLRKQFSKGNEERHYIKDFSIKDWIEIYALECLAVEYWHTTVCVRRLNKNGKLIVEKDEYYVINDSETEQAIHNFDKRNSKRKDLYSRTGIPLFDKQSNDGNILLAAYNVGGISTTLNELLDLENDGTKYELESNFILVPFDILSYYEYNKYLSDFFVEKYSFKFETLIKFIYVIYFRLFLIYQKDKSLVYQLLQRAYIISANCEYLINDISKISKAVNLKNFGSCEMNLEDVRTIFTALSNINPEKIELTTSYPMPLFINQKDVCVTNFSALLMILERIMMFVGVDKDLTYKGVIFEDSVRNKFEVNGIKIWDKRILNGFSTQRETDLVFERGEYLFVCELRCVQMRDGFIYGNKAALDFRQAKFKEALDIADKKSDWIIQNGQIPDNIKFIMPFAISPFVEYIDNISDAYWLKDWIPRIITPEELIDFVKGDPLPDLFLNRYIKKVKPKQKKDLPN